MKRARVIIALATTVVATGVVIVGVGVGEDDQAETIGVDVSTVVQKYPGVCVLLPPADLASARSLEQRLAQHFPTQRTLLVAWLVGASASDARTVSATLSAAGYAVTVRARTARVVEMRVTTRTERSAKALLRSANAVTRSLPASGGSVTGMAFPANACDGAREVRIR